MIKLNGITGDYEKFFNDCVNLAQEVLIRDGYHAPMCLVFQGNDKAIQPFLCHYKTQDEKHKWFDFFRDTYLEKLDAQAVIFISEGWIRIAKVDEEIKLPLADNYDDNQECLFISISCYNGARLIQIPFERISETKVKIPLGKPRHVEGYVDNLIQPFFERHGKPN